MSSTSTSMSALPPMSLELFAGARVRDYQAALAWWSRLLGEPTMHPHDTEAVWELADARHIYIVEDERGDGSAVATLFCDDLDERVAAISARGIHNGIAQVAPGSSVAAIIHGTLRIG